jgi:hypothetical protein
MKQVRVQTPKKNNLKLLGNHRSSGSSPMLKSLSVERNRKKLEKRISSQEKNQTKPFMSVGGGVEDQIVRLEAEWQDIQNQRKEQKERASAQKLSNRHSQRYTSTPYAGRLEASDVKYARIDLVGQNPSRMTSTSEIFAQQSQQLNSPERVLPSQHYFSMNEEVKSSRKHIKIMAIKMIPIKHPSKCANPPAQLAQSTPGPFFPGNAADANGRVSLGGY